MNDDGVVVLPPLAGVEVRRSGVHGHGFFATRASRAGEEIGCYAGRCCAADHVEDPWDDGLTYLFRLSDGSMIEARTPRS